jgi:hypothetical protein
VLILFVLHSPHLCLHHSHYWWTFMVPFTLAIQRSLRSSSSCLWSLADSSDERLSVAGRLSLFFLRACSCGLSIAQHVNMRESTQAAVLHREVDSAPLTCWTSCSALLFESYRTRLVLCVSSFELTLFALFDLVYCSVKNWL